MAYSSQSSSQRSMAAIIMAIVSAIILSPLYVEPRKYNRRYYNHYNNHYYYYYESKYWSSGFVLPMVLIGLIIAIRTSSSSRSMLLPSEPSWVLRIGSSSWGLEAEVIDEIVQDIINKFGHKFSVFADDLIGMAPRAEAVENLLDLDSEDVVCVVGIHGMGEIGKTTLAAVEYDKISHRFTPIDLEQIFDIRFQEMLKIRVLPYKIGEKVSYRNDPREALRSVGK
ncbi:TMV resistance protein N-like [Senna tora]|uniref:TMV resistance protein N-like n=1 Tax=Senna tora TaxID=362788 RepID=A0A834XI06_9FABA|nr:TMV resistance protein N-like [Senna tora]